MPWIGLGVGSYNVGTGGYGEHWNDTVCAQAVALFLGAGGRRIDTSLKWYNDLDGVREGIAASGVPRSEVFITSKVDEPFGYESTLSNVKQILSVLNSSYVDLVLMHWPAPMDWDFTTTAFDTTKVYSQSCGSPSKCRVDTLRALNDAVTQGLVRAAGVANFEMRHLKDLTDAGLPLPQVNQLEFHPYWHEDGYVQQLQQMNITVQSYSPFGAPDYMSQLPSKWSNVPLSEAAVQSVAQQVQRTPAQVLLRWQIQKGITVNPRSQDLSHMKENLNVFDFTLTAAQSALIDSITPPMRPKVCPDPFLLA